MHIHSSRYAVFAFSLSALATQLAGCEPCSRDHTPCGSKGKFLVCRGEDGSERWEETQCPGVDPICVELPDDQHRCDDARPPAPCPSLRVLHTPLLLSPGRLLDAADLDGNGRPDLLVDAITGGEFGQRVIVRVMQDSDGSFGLPVEIFAEMAQHQSLYVADVDGDKQLDFVESDLNTHTAHFGRTDGSFSESIVGMSLAQTILEVSDVDADGSADLIATAGDRLVVMGPPPDLTWRATLRVPRPPGLTQNFGSHIGDVKARDLDGDLRPELIAVSADDKLQAVSEVFVRTGDEWQLDTRSWAADSQAAFEFVADFNHDGIPDRVTWEDNAAERPRVFVATGDGAGKFRKHAARQLPENGWLHLGDFDGDGHMDIASVRESITVLRGRGDGSLEKPRSFGLPNIDAHAMSVLMTDFDQDGSPDLVGVDFAKVFVAPRACIEPN